MGAAYFYHLTRAPLEQTLPTLLSKAREAGWRVVVRGTDKQRMKWLDDKLWLGADERFLPHGLAGGEFDADQPVLLTVSRDYPNGARCLMLIDGAEVAPEEVDAMERVCILFDGNESSAVQTARQQWQQLSAANCEAAYWSEESGRWEKRAESGT